MLLIDGKEWLFSDHAEVNRFCDDVVKRTASADADGGWNWSTMDYCGAVQFMFRTGPEVSVYFEKAMAFDEPMEWPL
jgi:hypothetical protein